MTEPAVEPEAVDAALAVAVRIYEEERQRGQNLASKTATLAGFSGAILALVAQFGRELLRLDLGPAGDVLAPIVFLVSIAALAVAGALSLYGALRPRDRYVIDAAEVKRLATPEWLRLGKPAIEGALLTSLGEAFEYDRRINDLRARYLRHAGLALLVGIVTSAGLAAILGVRELGL
ncbi:MAG TPA: hypothetical protein VHF45_06355 [Thermoleophilaceae bacterium]|nr:hypothetical protein [Thermoleophilaceae bacterium]